MKLAELLLKYDKSNKMNDPNVNALMREVMSGNRVSKKDDKKKKKKADYDYR